MTTFNSSKLRPDPSKLKKKSDLYRWADFIELNAMLDVDKESSLQDSLKEPWGIDSGIISDFYSESDTDDKDTSKDEAENKVANRVDDLIKHLKIRKTLLGEYYPFEFIDKDLTLCEAERQPHLTHAHNLYRYLLVAANLPFITDDSIEKQLTKGFERLAYYAVVNMLPSFCEVRIFGTAATEGMKAYKGKKLEKLQALAADIGVKLTDDMLESPINPHDSADEGIDIAAWLPFCDYAGHGPLFLSQAGCTADEQEMLAKQNEVRSQVWKNIIRHIYPTPVMLTPACYRNASGNWVKPHKITSIFLDRVRIIKLMLNPPSDFTQEIIPHFGFAV